MIKYICSSIAVVREFNTTNFLQIYHLRLIIITVFTCTATISLLMHLRWEACIMLLLHRIGTSRPDAYPTTLRMTIGWWTRLIFALFTWFESLIYRSWLICLNFRIWRQDGLSMLLRRLLRDLNFVVQNHFKILAHQFGSLILFPQLANLLIIKAEGLHVYLTVQDLFLFILCKHHCDNFFSFRCIVN